MLRALASLSLCIVGLAPAGAAAEVSPFGDFTWSIGAGPSVPVFDASKHFPTGGQLNLGLGYRFLGRLTVEMDYLYSNYGITADFLQPGSFTATHTLQSGNLNFLVSVLPRPDRVDLYVAVGPGVYNRQVDISSVTGGPVPTFCDPGLFLCASTATAPAAATLARASRTDPGLNAGLGMSFSLGAPVRLFVDARIHLMWGTIRTPSGPRKANGQYIPVSIGLRYF